jgi:3-deoxy-D-manno-octulosonic-acid transferase
MYGILSTIIFMIILPFWLIAGVFKPKLIAGFMEKCGIYKNLISISSNKKTVIFYGVSVGEVIAIENLLKKTKEIFSDINIVLFTGTQTGQEIAHKKLGNTVDFISYFPFDFPFCIENMLKKIQPDAIFVAETELWPNFANIVHSKKIPLFIINGRISDRTFKSYKKLSFFFSPVLKKYTNIFTQSEQDNNKLISIGANDHTTTVMGNLKFDIQKPDTSSLKFKKDPQNKILIAASTHSGEDEIILETFIILKKSFPNLKLIIAPRHPERNENVFNLIKKNNLTCTKRSENVDFSPTEVILLDTMGELAKIYSICDIAFIGGSFNKTGGHNPLEATIFKKPVVSGPSIHNFKDIYSILTSSDAGKIVKTKEELTQHLHTLLLDENYYKKSSQDCETVFKQNQKALEFVIKVLQTLV